jgi:putative drug exporter of the RND superfamily
VIRALTWLVVRLRWLVVAGWVAAAIAATIWLPGLGSTQEANLGGLVPQNARAQQVERRSFDYFDVPLISRAVVVQRNEEGLTPAQQTRVLRRAAAINTREDTLLGTVVFALPVLNTAGIVPGSTERDTTAVTFLFYKPEASLQARAALADTYGTRIEADDDHLIGATGAAPARWEQWEAIEGALPWVEGATLLLIFLVVSLTFRAVGAPLIALVAAALAYFVSVGVVGWAGERLDLAVPREVEPVMLVLLLGVVTDYAVFFLSATRRHLAAGEPRVRAAESAANDVTPIVITTGAVVVFGTAALLVGELEFFRAFGPGAALAVAVSVAVSVTFIPAALAIFGERVFWPSLRRESADERSADRGTIATLTRFMTAKPVAALVTVGAVVVLVLATLQLRDTRLGFTLLTGLPEGSTAERALFEAGKGFEPGIVAPSVVLVEQEGIRGKRAELNRLERLLERQPNVAGVIGPREQPPELEVDALLTDDAARYALILGTDPLGGAALDAVRDLEGNLPDLLRQAGLAGATAGVAGDTALAAETVDRIVDDIKRIAVAALIVNFLFLVLFLRALLPPLYLLAASALGLGAALGVTAFVFNQLLGFGDLTYYVPFAAAVLLLSLGSDYNIFIVGRIWQEARDRPVRDAIVRAAPRASGAISIAGIALAGSFALLALVPLRAFREFALAMSAGILIDTFLVRTLLVPALVGLVGETNWWPRRRRIQAPTVDEAA